MTVIVQAGHLRTEEHCDPAMRVASGAIAEAAWTAVVAPLIVDALTKAAVSARGPGAMLVCAATARWQAIDRRTNGRRRAICLMPKEKRMALPSLQGSATFSSFVYPPG